MDIEAGHSASSKPPAQVETQPKSSELTFASILSFFRLCNPPPAAGKVRSCGVTPIYSVKLDDVLQRKHLPPLGLKDFEEWLLYVEQNPSGLYFLLWLKEYTVRYNQWATNSRSRSNIVHESNPSISSSLALFYARAKSTFLTPNGPFELNNVPSHLLAPFHMSNGPFFYHPEPDAFAEVSAETRRLLEESLSRFIVAQYSNVGNGRALCGMIAGVIFTLIGAVLPLAYNIAVSHSRYSRLTALPGMFLGLTILISSLRGVCIGIYVFGDLRQLKKFELSRPTISKPSRPQLIGRGGIVSPPSRVGRRSAYTREEATFSDAASITTMESAFNSSDDNAIYVSPVYYPEEEHCHGDQLNNRADKHGIPASHEEQEIFVSSAGFIRPYESSGEEIETCKESSPSASLRQPILPFDFESLPPRYGSVSNCSPSKFLVIKPDPNQEVDVSPPSLKNFISHFQERCSARRWLVPAQNSEKLPSSQHGHGRTESTESTSKDATIQSLKRRLRKINAVPSFGSPLTRVLNPVVVRAQWEVVVRSAVIAFTVSLSVNGILLAIPITR